MIVTKLITAISTFALLFTPIVEGVSAVLTVPGSNTIYAADAIMTVAYTLWSTDFFVASLSFGIVGGRVIWILRKYLAEEEGAGRKASNSVKDVREAFTQALSS